MKLLIFSTLTACLLASCAVPTPDLSNVKSVGVSNGMGNTLNRSKVGTTVFNNDSEKVNVPEISEKVSQTAVRNLKTRFSVVKNLSVATKKPAFQLLGRPDLIDMKAFKDDSIAAAKAQKLDSVWILYPMSFADYNARGPSLGGYEHRAEYILGMGRDTACCIAKAELVDARDGKTISQMPFIFPSISVIDTNRKWASKFDQYDATGQRMIIDGVTDAGKTAAVTLLNLAKITTSKDQ